MQDGSRHFTYLSTNTYSCFGLERKRRTVWHNITGHTCLESRPGRPRSKEPPPIPTQLAHSQVSDRTASSSLNHCFKITEFIGGKWSQGHPVWPSCPSWPWGGRCLGPELSSVTFFHLALAQRCKSRALSFSTGFILNTMHFVTLQFQNFIRRNLNSRLIHFKTNTFSFSKFKLISNWTLMIL